MRLYIHLHLNMEVAMKGRRKRECVREREGDKYDRRNDKRRRDKKGGIKRERERERWGGKSI